MNQKKLGCIILAAGKGSRMKTDIPKPLHKVAGLSMVGHVIKNVELMKPEKVVVVIGHDMEDMAKEVHPHTCVIQEIANGTGGAVLAARKHFKNFDGDILILYGDTPLVTPATMQKMVDTVRKFPAIGLTYAGMYPADPGKYGRMIKNEDGILERIVEFKDATDKEKEITLCNGGIVCADSTKLFKWLDKVDNHNAQGEYYLTDLPVIAREDNRLTHVVEVPALEMMGANSRGELAMLERIFQTRLRSKHMEGGATLIDPETVYFNYDTIVGQDVTIEPNVFFGSNVKIANNIHIKANSYIEDVQIDEWVKIGPFARIRGNSHIEYEAVVGNFVEIKQSQIGEGVKISHLSYIGNATIGEKTNIGAGTITCNYDGVEKHETKIGSNAFIGSNTSLVAPLTICDGAIIGAGSTITKNVEKNALALTRPDQKNVKDFGKKFRAKKAKNKK